VDFDPEVLDTWRQRGLPVFYGDVGDPELLEHLPLHRSRLVVSTVRNRDLNLDLHNALRARDYSGKVVLAARDDEEAQDFLTAGADMVLRPYSDAAEQAADSLTAALHVFTQRVDWPVTLGMFRLEPDSLVAGRLIGELTLRQETGVTIIAVNRGSKTYFDPDPRMALYPGDRLILLGEPERLAQAEAFLELNQIEEEDAEEERFSIAEIPLAADSPLVGKSLSESRFRENYGVTVVGIRRGDRRSTAPGGDEILQAGDSLMVAGKREEVKKLESKAPW